MAQALHSKDPEVVSEAFNRAYRQRDWPGAIELGLRLVELLPESGAAAYNLACVYSLSGDGDRAVDWLDKAARRGFSRVTQMEEDPDLKAVRVHAGYRAVLERVSANLASRHKRLERVFKKTPPLIYLPNQYDRERESALIIALHGYGGRAAEVADKWRDVAADAGAILAVPQAVHRVKGAGFQWGSVEDAEFIVELTLERVRKDYRLQNSRIILTGFSQGGFMAYAVALRNLSLFSGVIPMATGYIPSVDAPSPPTVDRPPRFYFMVGEHDRIRRQCEKAVKDFTAAGYDVELRVYPGTGHAFPKDSRMELQRALDFVRRR